MTATFESARARRYLLGEASEEECAALEREYLEDEEALDRMAASEDDLIEGLGREREEGIAQSDLGVLAYLAYDYASARTHYAQAMPRHRSTGDILGEATTLVRLGWLAFAGGEQSRVIELDRQAIPLWREAGERVRDPCARAVPGGRLASGAGTAAVLASGSVGGGIAGSAPVGPSGH